MVRKLLISAGLAAVIIFAASCSRVRRSPGRAYMPDMAYSRAYETYSSTEELRKKGINYNALPVPGTVARGDHFSYALRNDSMGYIQSATTKNPLDSTAIDLKESERLYLVNCGICHGAKLDGNGPLFNNAAGPFQAKPATLVGDATYEKMTEGTMFHSITYGKGAMGSYASQLSVPQRWMVIAYIKSKQGGKMAGPAVTTDSTAIPKP